MGFIINGHCTHYNHVLRPVVLETSMETPFFTRQRCRSVYIGFWIEKLHRWGALSGVGPDRRFWTGIFLGELPLGYYSKAFSFARMPKELLGGPLVDIIRGSYAELKSDRGRLSRYFNIYNSVLLRSGFFAAGLLFLSAPEVIHIFLGEKWMPMLPAFQLMLVFTLIDPVKLSIGNIFIAVGRPEIIGRARFIQLIIMIAGLFILGLPFGIAGVAISVDIMVIVGLVQQLYLVREYVDYSWKDLFLTPVLSLMTGIACYSILSFWIQFDSLYISAVIKTVIFSFGFIGSFLLLEYRLVKEEYLPLILRAVSRQKGEAFFSQE